MAKHAIEVFKCDRCGHKTESSNASAFYAWGRIHVEQVNGHLRIGGGGEKPKFADLCPGCIGDVIRWFERSEDPRP